MTNSELTRAPGLVVANDCNLLLDPLWSPIVISVTISVTFPVVLVVHTIPALRVGTYFLYSFVIA